jgi:diguanylate cyclase (GGDEF)-like protein
MSRLSAVIAGAALSLSLSAAVHASPTQTETLERAVQTLEDELVELSRPPQPAGAASAEPTAAFKAADEAAWDALIELQNAGAYVPPRALMVLQLMPPPDSTAQRPQAEDYRLGIDALRQSANRPPPANFGANATGTDNTTSDTIAVSAVAVALLGLVIGCGALWRGRRHDQLASIACTDGLTGLMNRRQFDLDVGTTSQRAKTCTAALMIDVDHFKSFNDTYGHACGDDVLRQVSNTIDRNIRRGDVAYRYGGEEFSVLLPGTDKEAAEIVAERVRHAIETISLDYDAHVTASIGVASAASKQLESVVVAADAAMFNAKSAGRNRTMVDGNGDLPALV